MGPFCWGTAELLMGVLRQDEVRLGGLCERSAQQLQGEFQFTEDEVRVREKGEAYLKECGLPSIAWEAFREHHRNLGELQRVRETMCSLPQYMAAAHRGQIGWGAGSGKGLEEVAQVLVRYDRKEVQVGNGVKLYGRAYPGVLNFEDFTRQARALSLTALPRQVRNALVSYPRPLLVDMDMVKCYPSIMLALAGMHGLGRAQVELLSEYVSGPGAVACRVSEEEGCEEGAVKGMVNKLISDPRPCHQGSRNGWIARLEREVHSLRDELIDRHPHRDAFWALARGGGGAPNVGTMVYRVLTDYEVQVLAQAARVFTGAGVRVATYEYDGMKVSADHWGGLGSDGQDRLLEAARVAIDDGVFGGKAAGVVRLAVKPMGYERYEQGLKEGAEEWAAVQEGGDGMGQPHCDLSSQQGASGRLPSFDNEEGGAAQGEAFPEEAEVMGRRGRRRGQGPSPDPDLATGHRGGRREGAAAGVRGRAKVRSMLKEMELVHVHVEPMTHLWAAGEETGDNTARALGAKLKAVGDGGEQGAVQRKRRGEEAEWDSGHTDARGLEGEGSAG